MATMHYLLLEQLAIIFFEIKIPSSIIQTMRLLLDLFSFVGIVSLLPLSIAIPTRPRLFGSSDVQEDWALLLGGGWRFHYTTPPAMFLPIEPAAQSLNYLYELAKSKANSIGTSSESINRYSDATMFRVGHFALIFRSNFDPNYDKEWKARISWPAIATFCERMQAYVRRGEVLYYKGLIQGITGTEGAIAVELRLVQES